MAPNPDAEAFVIILILFGPVIIAYFIRAYFWDYKNTRYYQTKVMKDMLQANKEYLESRQQYEPTMQPYFEQHIKQQPVVKKNSGYVKFLRIILFIGLCAIFYFFYVK